MVIWSKIWPVLVALLILGIIIMIHEVGHFVAGRIFKFRIDEFAVGFGPKIVSKKAKSGTVFSLRALPLGGFCRFHGEDEEEQDKDPDAFNAKPAWQRLIVLLSGVTMNFVLAFVLSFILLLGYGSAMPQVAVVNENSPAQIAGLQVGDNIVAIDGKDAYYYRATNQIKKANPSGVTLTISRDNQQEDIQVNNIYDQNANKNMLGISFTVSAQDSFSYSPGEAFLNAGSYMVDFGKNMILSVAELFKKPAELATSVSGPIGTVQVISATIQYGLETTLTIAMFLSLNVAIFNLLPFPALDGGRVIFALIEIISPKPVPRKVEGMIHVVGFLLLIILMLFATWGDLSRLFGG